MPRKADDAGRAGGPGATFPRKRRPRLNKPRGDAATTGPVTFDDVRKAAKALPEVEDGTSYGTPALKVRGKLMARLHQDRDLDCFVLRADLLDREMMIQAAPDVFFITDHYRDHPWVLVRFAAVGRRALPALLERAWRLVVPARLAEQFDG